MRKTRNSAKTTFDNGQWIGFSQTREGGYVGEVSLGFQEGYIGTVDRIAWCKSPDLWRVRCFYDWLCSDSKRFDSITWLWIYWEDDYQTEAMESIKRAGEVCESILNETDEDNAIAIIEIYLADRYGAMEDESEDERRTRRTEAISSLNRSEPQ